MDGHLFIFLQNQKCLNVELTLFLKKQHIPRNHMKLPLLVKSGIIFIPHVSGITCSLAALWIWCDRDLWGKLRHSNTTSERNYNLVSNLFKKLMRTYCA